MACNVYVNKKLTIDCSVSAFQTMYDVFDKYANLNDYYSDLDFKNLMFEMFTAAESRCSYGFDFADYIKTGHAIDLLLKIIDESIPELREELIERVIESILRLRAELLNYKTSLTVNSSSIV